MGKEEKIEDLTPLEMRELAEAIENSTIGNDKSEDSTESFFKEVAKGLDDIKKISLNTEYLSVPENFTGVNLEFLGSYANMPYLKVWILIFEKKRVSLHRKGRQEKVMILQQRNQEIERQQQVNFQKMFNVNPT